MLESAGGRVGLVASGLLKPPADASPERKLALIYDGLAGLIERHRPALLVLEQAFYHKNVKTVLRLGEVRGICLLAAARAGIKTAQYSPRRVKKAVVGRGSAAKQQVARMVQVLLDLPAPPESFDVSDALALGLTYFQDKRMNGEIRNPNDE